MGHPGFLEAFTVSSVPADLVVGLGTDFAKRVMRSGSADYDIGEFAWHYDHFYDLLPGDCGLDLFGQQRALADYGL